MLRPCLGRIEEEVEDEGEGREITNPKPPSPHSSDS